MSDDDWGASETTANSNKVMSRGRGRGLPALSSSPVNDDWGDSGKTNSVSQSDVKVKTSGDDWADDAWGDSAANSGANSGGYNGGYGGQNNRTFRGDRGGDRAGGGGPRSCFNCGETGHQSRDCSQPRKERSGPRKCYNCDGEGHTSRDCTEPRKERSGGRSCYNCGESGHMSNNCPNPKKEGARRPRIDLNGGNTNSDSSWDFGGGNSSANASAKKDDFDWDTTDSQSNANRNSESKGGNGCRKCGEDGHFARECPQGGNSGGNDRACRRCNKEGHIAKDCTEEVLDENGKPKPPPYMPQLISEDDENLYNTVPTGINFDRYDKIKVSISGENPPKQISKFGEAITSELMLSAIERCKYLKPTPVQKYAIPIIMQKRDLMACAQTGSGKTGAFLLPILQELLNMKDLPSLYGQPVQEPLCVVISPTRELAIQIHTEAVKFAKGSIVKPALIYGGTSSGYQLANISRGAHILVATPGRLLDFVDKGKVLFTNLKYLILDEADRMIDQGFLPEVRRMVTHSSMPKKDDRQTLMFSATFPDEVQRMAVEFLSNDYLFLTVGIVGAANSDVEQTFIEVDGKQKRSKLMDILNNCESTDRTLVFVEKKKTADFLASFLSQNQMKSTSIHGDRFQSQRETALYDFRTGNMPILVATSVAARGLDIKDVKHVINYDLPKEIDEYVHRIGRTGRVGNVGKATSFFDPLCDNDVSLAKGLIKILSDADQVVPDFLQSGSHRSSYNDTNSASFGGTDIRKDTTAVTNEDEGWD